MKKVQALTTKGKSRPAGGGQSGPLIEAQGGSTAQPAPPATPPEPPRTHRHAGEAGLPDYEHAVLECYVDGRFELMPFDKAWRKLWQVDFGWVLPLDWYRYEWGGFADRGHVRPLAEDSGRIFGFHLLTQDIPLSRSRLVEVEPTMEDTEDNAFIARAARFNRLIPKELRKSAPLFVHHPVFDSFGRLEPGYHVAVGRRTLVIAGADRDSAVAPPAVNWSALLRPPGTPPAATEKTRLAP